MVDFEKIDLVRNKEEISFRCRFTGSPFRGFLSDAETALEIMAEEELKE